MKSRASSAANASVKRWFGASALMVSGLALLPLGVALAAESGSAQHSTLFNFAIAAKPLPQALSDFTRVTGISVVYTSEAPYGLKAPALNGQFSAEQAVQRLLGNSGFSYRRSDAHTLVLEPLPQGAALNLGATSVTAVGADDSTSYQPPATTSVARSQALNQEIPQIINVVPAQVLKDQTPRNLDDALKNVSGIT